VRHGIEDEFATLAAHLNAATARWLELVVAAEREGVAPVDELALWLSFRCGPERGGRHTGRVRAGRRVPAASLSAER
jgi:hypothetical protein